MSDIQEIFNRLEEVVIDCLQDPHRRKRLIAIVRLKELEQAISKQQEDIEILDKIEKLKG